MPAKYFRLLGLLSFFYLFSFALSIPAARAVETITPSPFTFPATVTADDTNTVTVTLAGVAAPPTTITLSLVDSTSTTATTVPAANGATVTSLEGNVITTGNGALTFHQIQITKPSGAAPYKLRLATTAGTVALSNTFAVTVGQLHTVTLTGGPTPNAPPLTADPTSLFTLSGQATDAEGNGIGGATVTATLVSAGAATLTDTTTPSPVTTNAAGNFSFTKLNINKTGTYTLTVSAAKAANPTVTSAASAPVTVSSGTVAAVSISQQPPNSVLAGAQYSLSAAVTDAEGNAAADGTTITLSLTNADGSAVAAGTTFTNQTGTPTTPPAVTTTGGSAQFNNLVTTPPGSYRIIASKGAVHSSASNAFSVIAGAPSTVTLSAVTPTTPPALTTDTALSLSATVKDSNGIPVADGTPVTLTLLDAAANPVADQTVLTGNTATTSGGAGIATFTFHITKVGTYKLKAASGSATPAVSAAVTIQAGAANRISFTQQPSSTAAGSVITPAVTVAIQDAGGNPVGSVSVLLTLLGGGTLSGTNPVLTDALGTATFSTLKVNAPGTYQVTATAGSLTVTSNIFNVTAGAPTTLVFGQPPTSTASGAVINPPVTVLLKDGSGNLTTSTAPVTLTITTGPAGATLGGTLAVNAVNGVATFADLTLDKAGAYTLTASSTGGPPAIASVTSSSFNITAGAAHILTFSVQPTTNPASPAQIASGALIPITVQVKDTNNNPVPGVSVTLTPTTGTLNGTATIVTAASGTATFTDLSISKSGSVTLLASVAGVAAVSSNPFTITAGPTASLSFTTQPTSAAAGAVLNSPGSVVVTATDIKGNPTGGVSVTVALSGGTGSLFGTKTKVTDAGGNATFSDLSVNKTGSGYFLTASAPGVTPTAPTPIPSSTFTITAGAATTLTFAGGSQPTTTAAGAVINSPGGVVVLATDSQGNPVSGINVTLALSGGAGTLAGTSAVNTDSNGKATFSNLSVDKTGSYTLTASAPGVTPLPTPAVSNSFTITQGAAAIVSFMQQPTTASAGTDIAPPVAVLVTDAGGNSVGGVSVALTLSGGLGTLGGTKMQTTGDGTSGTTLGVAVFNDLKVDKTGNSYVLTAAVTGATPAASTPFAITAGLPHLTFKTQPATSQSGAPIPVVVNLQDTSGNLLSGQSVTLTVSPGTFTPTSTTTVSTDGNGDATFSNLSISQAATGYTITASAPGVTPAAPPAIQSNAFDITSGAVSAVTFTGQPSNVAATPTNATTPTVITPAVIVTVTDAAGNPIANQSVQVALAPGSTGTLGGILSQPTDASGQAAFTKLSINTPGTKQLTATVTVGNTQTQATSTSFLVGNLPSAINSLSNIGSIHAGDPAFTLTITGSNFVVPTTADPGSTVAFTTTDPDTGATKTTSLSLTGTPTSTILTALVPASLITQALTATVSVTNPAGTSSTNLAPAISSFPILPLGPSADSTGTAHPKDANSIPRQYFDPGLQLFSVPFDYTADSTGTKLAVNNVLRVFKLSDISDTLTPIKLAVWDPSVPTYAFTDTATNSITSLADQLVLGRGYWGRFQDQTSGTETGLKTRGLEAANILGKLNAQGQFSITLQPGWNMIGDPFAHSANSTDPVTGAVKLSDIQVQATDASIPPISLAAANDNGLVSETFYKYAGGAYVAVQPTTQTGVDNQLKPYIGYWVLAYQPCTLLIPQP